MGHHVCVFTSCFIILKEKNCDLVGLFESSSLDDSRLCNLVIREQFHSFLKSGSLFYLYFIFEVSLSMHMWNSCSP